MQNSSSNIVLSDLETHMRLRQLFARLSRYTYLVTYKDRSDNSQTEVAVNSSIHS